MLLIYRLTGIPARAFSRDLPSNDFDLRDVREGKHLDFVSFSPRAVTWQ